MSRPSCSKEKRRNLALFTREKRESEGLLLPFLHQDTSLGKKGGREKRKEKTLFIGERERKTRNESSPIVGQKGEEEKEGEVKKKKEMKEGEDKTKKKKKVDSYL